MLVIFGPKIPRNSGFGKKSNWDPNISKKQSKAEIWFIFAINNIKLIVDQINKSKNESLFD